jgi:glutamyl-Q tRNA(Asp) synthetase
MSVVTRFAPSPTGELHLGSAYSAWTGWHRAREAGGTFLVRIEDIDIRRCKREYETAILADLKWLGFHWDGEVRRQSEHFADYGKALDQLDRRGLIYPCFCSRADIAASVNAPHGPDGPLYAGTCRNLSPQERRDRIATGREFCLRLDAGRAARGQFITSSTRRGASSSPCCWATSCSHGRTRRRAITSRSRSTIICRA